MHVWPARKGIRFVINDSLEGYHSKEVEKAISKSVFPSPWISAAKQSRDSALSKSKLYKVDGERRRSDR